MPPVNDKTKSADRFRQIYKTQEFSKHFQYYSCLIFFKVILLQDTYDLHPPGLLSLSVFPLTPLTSFRLAEANLVPRAILKN